MKTEHLDPYRMPKAIQTEQGYM